MKQKISASVYFQKRVFPVLWAGFVGVFALLPWIVPRRAGDPGPLPFTAMAVFMLGLAWVLLRRLIFDLADEVYDCGDALLVRRGDVEERVPLSSIVNVSASTLQNPARVSLRLASPGRFGDEIAFVPLRRFTLNPFARIPVVEDLILRVDRARRER